MPARRPEECDIHLMEAMNRGYLEAAAALYEPNATLVQNSSGEVVTVTWLFVIDKPWGAGLE